MIKKTDKVTKFIGPLSKSNRKSTKKIPRETLDAKKILGLITIYSQDSEL